MSTTTFHSVRRALQDLADPTIAEHSLRFFKTGPGDYGEGDQFLGIRVPEQRKIARRFVDLRRQDVLQLLKSPWHEERLTALLVWVLQFNQGNEDSRLSIYDSYLQHTDWINNWDLVDSSAPHIVGAHLFKKSRQSLVPLAKSSSLWERRIAILATFFFIKHNQFQDTLKLAQLLLHDGEDLMHKAVGWMLREVGNRDHDVEDAFLQKHYRDMPRTMLRYAIERFPEHRRQAYLTGTATS